MTTPDQFPTPRSATPRPPGPTSPFTPVEAGRGNRTRRVRIACTLITVVCGLFAAVLLAQIIMVMGDANAGNGVATFVRGWSGAVSLGFENLFTPANQAFRTFLNNGLAAIVWLALGAIATMLVRRLALPGPDQPR